MSEEIALDGSQGEGRIDREKVMPAANQVLMPGGTFQAGNFGGLDPKIKPALQKAGFVEIVGPLPDREFITAKSPDPDIIIGWISKDGIVR